MAIVFIVVGVILLLGSLDTNEQDEAQTAAGAGLGVIFLIIGISMS